MNKKIYLPAFLILIPYPIFLVCMSVWYGMKFSIGIPELCMIIISYYGSNIAIGIGMHRLWSHNSYKTNNFVHFVLAVLSAGCLQGPSLVWASDHRLHHSYADKDLDPHSPVKYKDNKLKGFLWAHLGWMLIKDDKKKHVDSITMKTLGRNPILRWQMKIYWQLAAFMNIVPPAIFGCLFLQEMSIGAALSGILFFGLGRAIQQQMTFCVNSLCHFIGKKKYANDSSYDIWWLAPMLLGENWHNFHHAFGRDYRNGHKFYHFDVHKWIIWLMSKVGLAHSLVITPDVRIAAKEEEMKNVIWRNDLVNTKNAAEMISARIRKQVDKIDEYFKEKSNDISLANLKSFGINLHEGMSKKLSMKQLNILQKKLLKIDLKASRLSSRIASITASSDEFVKSVNSSIVCKLSKELVKLQKMSENIIY